jgi:23S rRNA pseudouridine2457 synthase
MLIAFNKPYGVLSQFTPEHPGQRTLAEFGFPKKVYPIGRLDADTEGLLLLSDEADVNERLLHPRHAHEREYWALVERVPTAEALQKLARGVVIQGRKTLPGRAWMLDPQPVEAGGRGEDAAQTFPATLRTRASAATITLPPRDPPVRFRKIVPTCWIGLELIEGKNRQVRRMSAAIGHPTLRLLRVRIGGLRLEQLPVGKWKRLIRQERQSALRQNLNLASTDEGRGLFAL